MATPPTKPSPELAPDPSMEDILASIRRILNEDDTPKSAPDPEEPDNGVLMLDNSMMVSETPDAPPPAARPAAPATLEHKPLPEPEPQAATAPTAVPATSVAASSAPSASLVAPAAAAAAGASVSELMRALASERSTAVQRGGPTIEDLVRIEIRPLLKDWLDNHLPPLVERLVRAEIERVVSRMAP